MTTLTQNARRKLRLILSVTNYLAIGCKNFGCFWFNWFLVFFALELSTRNLSCPSAFSFNQLLKSKSVDRCQLCLTVCIDQASLRLVTAFLRIESLLTAWFNRLTLFRSSLNDNDLKNCYEARYGKGETNEIFRIVHLKWRKVEEKYSAYQDAHQQ